jgi:fatty acyl-CoA reductase
MSCLVFYTMREWNFVSRNPVQLLDKMSDEEQSTFNFDVRKIDWETYMTNFVTGVGKYLFKEDVGTLPDDTRRKSLNK